MDDFSRHLFHTALLQAIERRADRNKYEPLRCPACGGDLSGELARDGSEDETCGSPHCREQWYSEVHERY